MAMRLCAILALCWTVTATPIRIIDGDTFVATLPIWLGLTIEEHIRVLGVNAPELHAPTLSAGQAAKDFTSAWLAQGPIQVMGCQRDSFGRLLGRVFRGQDSLATALIQAGHGVPYP